ncbi:MAG TPA: ribosome maturation factor RimM [Actinomycetota bacterium]|nr:ribosome maturation factor RimM [Actinomycetota bacterium]
MIAGEIGKPHGVAGDVYVVRISDDPARFDPGARLIHSDGRTLVVEGSRVHRDRFLVKFEGVDSRAEAEVMRGVLYIPADEARELSEDEVWVHEIVGFDAVDEQGRALGEVAAIQPNPAHDLLELTTTTGTKLVPMVKEIVTRIDRDERRVVLDPPEGLLD